MEHSTSVYFAKCTNFFLFTVAVNRKKFSCPKRISNLACVFFIVSDIWTTKKNNSYHLKLLPR